MPLLFDSVQSLAFGVGKRRLAAAAVVLAVGAAACGGGKPPAGGAQGAPGGGAMAMPVEVITLQPKPVEDTSDFIGTIKSRRSTTVQPQVEGFITKILVKSGDRVQPGAALLTIDDTSQQAAVANLESLRAAREADAGWARQQVNRLKTLYDAGASSLQEYQQAQAAQKSAEAQLQAVDQQIKQQRNELSYYTVKASTDGVVGDIPVRQGDRVTKATVITTLDTNAGLELYLNVPVQQAARLHIGLPVRLLDDAGGVMSTETVSFISPSVDDANQTVLAKATLANGSRFRSDQFVRTRVIWKTEPGLTIPVVAVQRIAGQTFVFTVETTGANSVARQKPVTVGPIIGNDYVVLSGLKAGDVLVVGGTQKIGEGMPVRAGGPGPGAGAAPAGGR